MILICFGRTNSGQLPSTFKTDREKQDVPHFSCLQNEASAQLKKNQQKPQTTVSSNELLTEKILAELTVVFVLTSTYYQLHQSKLS